MEESKLYLKGLSIPDISKITGTPLSSLRTKLKNFGILRSRAEGVRLAASAGKLGKNKGIKRVFSDSHRVNISRGKIRSAEINAKGTRVSPDGYVEYTRGPNKGRGQHCVFMEQHSGRKLFSNECVHHKDEDKSNNEISNLEDYDKIGTRKISHGKKERWTWLV